MSNAQFAQNVYDFQMEVFQQLLDEFDGKVVGSDEFNLETLKEKFFEGYKPGDKMKVAKEKKEKKEKKPRPLTGYTYFVHANKENFKLEMEKLDEKLPYVTYAGKKWKELNEAAKEEWKGKAKVIFEDSQKS
jgi:hypothetical protein